ncbi:MAG: PilZ domain-containing protein [Methylobacterium sp.]|jgi:hypothetical protein|uniref:PilZ domain-containing protein n=1 Tax=Methylobacterium sp. TaxID=409 RepID=UPI0025DA6FC6|nr:PilZ domain-containing protein [Methylobacterium sp.]MBX9934743.1 PilZ domain-containing protein [Methylobacterium sp.]
MPQDAQQPDDAGQAAFPGRAQRNKTDWIGIIRTPDGSEIPCTVKDVSKTGAKIAVPASYTLPDSFMLKVVGKDYVCRVKLAWRRGHFAGLIIEQFAKIAPKAVRPLAQTSSDPRDTVDPNYQAVGTRRSKVSAF